MATPATAGTPILKRQGPWWGGGCLNRYPEEWVMPQLSFNDWTELQRHSDRNRMEHQGRLTQWNDDRGFGFITPRSGGPRVFVHISQFQQRSRRPRLNDVVFYRLGVDRQGRPRAMQVRDQRNRQPQQPVNTKPFSWVVPIAAVVLILLGLVSITTRTASVSPSQPPPPSSTSTANPAIDNAFRAQQSGVQVSGDGVVARVLPDDNQGSRHQRFILQLASGQTLLIAHNIDIAPRIPSLNTGDRVAFSGQFEWNPEGGVIHWTHRDPAGSHVAGWLQHNGVVYQ